MIFSYPLSMNDIFLSKINHQLRGLQSKLGPELYILSLMIAAFSFYSTDIISGNFFQFEILTFQSYTIRTPVNFTDLYNERRKTRILIGLEECVIRVPEQGGILQGKGPGNDFSRVQRLEHVEDVVFQSFSLLKVFFNVSLLSKTIVHNILLKFLRCWGNMNYVASEPRSENTCKRSKYTFDSNQVINLFN